MKLTEGKMNKQEIFGKIDQYSKEYKDEMIKTRRDLHKIPEISHDLPKTREYILNKLKNYDLEIREMVGDGGITATLKFPNPGKNIAYRADMDALPIEEENEVDYRSEHKGKMHACGHDVHVTVALSILKVMYNFREELSGSIKFIFQPAEETDGGALGMIKDGALENPKVDFIFGSHVWPSIETGGIGLKQGPIMAGTDMIEINVQGKGGHIAMPHKSVNPLVVCSKIVNEIEGFKNYFIDSKENAVISFGALNAGETYNIIPDKGILKGSVRTFNKETKDIIKNKFQTVVDNIGEIYDAKCTLNYKENYPPTINDDEVVEKVEEILVDLKETNRINKIKHPSMGAEDFSYFLQEVPGAFIFLGTKNEEKNITWGIHNPKFNVDEDILEIAAKIYPKIIIEFLDK